jgi:hypothetical protein
MGRAPNEIAAAHDIPVLQLIGRPGWEILFLDKLPFAAVAPHVVQQELILFPKVTACEPSCILRHAYAAQSVC